MDVREVEIEEVLYGDIKVSAIRKPGAGYLYNRMTKFQRTTTGVWNLNPPTWATYAYVSMYGGGGGGGAGSGTLPLRGSAGRSGELYAGGYFLDGSLSGETFKFFIGSGGTGGNSATTSGNKGGSTTLILGTYTELAEGGRGGIGADAGGAANGETADYSPTGADALRFDKGSISWPGGSGGTYGDSRAGTPGDSGGHGGGAGAGGIFNRWYAGGAGGRGIARVVFWGVDPYVDPATNPHAN